MNPDFQSGTAKGVSSAIVLSKNQSFDIFAKPNFQGLQQKLKPGQWYATPNAMGFPNDLLQSVRKIWKVHSASATAFILLGFSPSYSFKDSFWSMLLYWAEAVTIHLFFNVVKTERDWQFELKNMCPQ